jgi:HAD superfamily hydrolase (TIGR01484 family)
VSSIRLVATDLDGTLLGASGLISDFTRRTLRQVQDAGVHLVFVTGRPPRWMDALVEATGHRGTAICANGAVVYDFAEQQVEAVRAMDAATALEVARRLRELVPSIAFAVERVEADRRSDVEFGREPHYVPRWPWPEAPWRAPIDDLVADGGVIKLLARVPDEGAASMRSTEDADELLTRAEKALVGVATPTHSNPRDRLLEISALGVTKASALAELSVAYGIAASEVIAFGDQPNDLAMLAWAGRSVAVANAHPAVLAAVDEHAPSVDDDGVAHTLHRVLNLSALGT